MKNKAPPNSPTNGITNEPKRKEKNDIPMETNSVSESSNVNRQFKRVKRQSNLATSNKILSFQNIEYDIVSKLFVLIFRTLNLSPNNPQLLKKLCLLLNC